MGRPADRRLSRIISHIADTLARRNIGASGPARRRSLPKSFRAGPCGLDIVRTARLVLRQGGSGTVGVAPWREVKKCVSREILSAFPVWGKPTDTSCGRKSLPQCDSLARCTIGTSTPARQTSLPKSFRAGPCGLDFVRTARLVLGQGRILTVSVAPRKRVKKCVTHEFLSAFLVWGKPTDVCGVRAKLIPFDLLARRNIGT